MLTDDSQQMFDVYRDVYPSISQHLWNRLDIFMTELICRL